MNLDLDKVKTGVTKIHYEVVAIDASENYFQFIELFENYISALKFCEESEFKYDVYMTCGVNHCVLKILKVTTEVM